jgi:hypothetical protein
MEYLSALEAIKSSFRKEAYRSGMLWDTEFICPARCSGFSSG